MFFFSWVLILLRDFLHDIRNIWWYISLHFWVQVNKNIHRHMRNEITVLFWVMYESIQRIHLVNAKLVKIWHILHLDIILTPLGTSDGSINTFVMYISPPCIFILKLLCIVNNFFCYRHGMGLYVHPLFKKLHFPAHPSLSFLLKKWRDIFLKHLSYYVLKYKSSKQRRH